MNRSVAQKWYRQALHDPEIAERNVAIGGYDTAAFLAQQAVEKTMKAVCALGGDKPPRTHNLDDLAGILGLSAELTDLAYDLAGDYMFSRYPDVADHVPFEEYTAEIALEKIGSATTLIQYLRKTHPELEELANG